MCCRYSADRSLRSGNRTVFDRVRRLRSSLSSIISDRQCIVSPMETDALDLSRSPIAIPPQFWGIRYNGDNFPDALGTHGIEGGVNCQQYAYSVLRHFGFEVPDFRSSELWDDTAHTIISRNMKAFDLVLVHNEPRSYGAHVGVSLGRGLVLHLSKKFDLPAIETLKQMQRRDEYRHLIGFKTVRVRRLPS